MNENLRNGDESCPCEQPGKIKDLSCNDADSEDSKNLSNLILGKTDKFCFPKNYGAFCGVHLIPITSNPSTNENMISLGEEKWCFVNEEKCFSSNITYVKYDIMRDVYISKDTCSEKNKVPSKLSAKETIKSVFHPKPAIFQVSVNNLEYPFVYKNRNDKIEPFESDITLPIDGNNLTGAAIDYFNEMIRLTDIEAFILRPTSKAFPTEEFGKNYSQTSGVSSDLDFTNRAISLDLAHLSMIPTYYTSARHIEFDFTKPLYTTNIYLFEHPHDFERGFWANVKKTFRPFTVPLCISMFFILLVAGFANIRFASKSGDHSRWHRARKYLAHKHLSTSRRGVIYVQLGVGSIIHGFLQCFQGGTEIDSPSNLSHKMLGIGFGVFILIFQTSYTANLASFLTRREYVEKTHSVNEAILHNKKICISPDLKNDTVKIIFDSTSFDYSSIDEAFVAVPGEPYFKNAIKYLDDSKCDSIAVDENHVITANGTFLCDDESPKIVTYDVHVRKVDVVLPVHFRYRDFFNDIIHQLNSEGISFLDIVQQEYSTALTCDIYRSDRNIYSDMEQFEIDDMYFPFMLLILCMIIGACIKITSGKRLALFRSVYKDLDEKERQEEMEKKAKAHSLRSSTKYRELASYQNRINNLTDEISKLNNGYDTYLQNLIDLDDNYNHDESFHSACSKEV